MITLYHTAVVSCLLRSLFATAVLQRLDSSVPKEMCDEAFTVGLLFGDWEVITLPSSLHARRTSRRDRDYRRFSGTIAASRAECP
jgi:hypothetical protein